MSDPAVFDLNGGRVLLGGTPVLSQVDFRLDRGEFLALLGDNGSGKTTLVRALLGLVPLAEGDIRLFGTPLHRFRDWARVGYVPQRPSVLSGAPASVVEVVLSGRIARSNRWRAFTARDRAAAIASLEAVGLADHARTALTRLSGGQQQRVLIARALAVEPDVLVLDEPVSGVDLERQEGFAHTLADYHAGGGSVLLVAHALGEMEDLVTREVVLERGEVVYDGPHHPHHVHSEHTHHREARPEHSPVDRAVGGH